MSQDLIGPNKKVTLHFTVAMMDGTVVDSTKSKQPATFTVGDGSFLPGFEAALMGLKAGDKRSVFLQAAQAFGDINPDNVHRMRRSQFQDMELHEGLVISFADKAKAELPGVVKGFDDEAVDIDFNHPLAGRDLNFEVEIIRVLDADAQTVQLQS